MAVSLLKSLGERPLAGALAPGVRTAGGRAGFEMFEGQRGGPGQLGVFQLGDNTKFNMAKTGEKKKTN